MTTYEPTVRTAVGDDLDEIGGLWREFMDFHKVRDPHFTRRSDGHERFKEFISGHMKSENSSVLVAEQGGEIVGYCLGVIAEYPPVIEHRSYGSVFDLAVTERCRRNRIGEALFREVETWFAEHGVHRIEVRVAVSNEVSTAFWRKMGFDPFIETLLKEIRR